VITKLGKQKLEEQLLQLKAELNRTCEARGKAAEEGDLKENSAYIFLGERALVLYSQIDQVKADLHQEVIQPAPTQTDTIVFGSQIKIRFESDGRELDITLVGKNDFNLQPGWISSESPLGIALLNQSKGSKVFVNDQPVTILDIFIGEI
jgi:transcription elongation GreA/GreB family factor